MRNFELSFEPLEGEFNDPVEQAAFARLWLSLDERMLTRCIGRRSGARDYVKLPLDRLALGLAENWWTLLYEPWRPEESTPARIARHRLDAFTPGYVFPAVGLWSAGDEAITIATNRTRILDDARGIKLSSREQEIATRFGEQPPVNPRALARTSFVDESRERVTVSRAEVEGQLYALVDEVLDWIDTEGVEHPRLVDRWSRVVESMNNEEMRNYCVAAGRLGFDPYDEETPDISVFASYLPEESFDDLCDAAPFEELSDASVWVSSEQDRLDRATPVDVSDFGERPALRADEPAWRSGYRAAIALRQKLKLDDDPLAATRRLFGTGADVIQGDSPPSVEGLLVREPGQVRSLVVARSSAQRRFRECRSAYLGWGAQVESYPLMTTASTHRQQASRAFGAEMLCPAEYLKHKAGRFGLTSDKVNDIAQLLDCDSAIVEHQAINHKIPLRGIY